MTARLAFTAVISFALGVLVRDVAQDWRDESRALEQMPVHQAARIWSRRCESVGLQLVAGRSDMGPTTIRCVRADLTKAAAK